MEKKERGRGVEKESKREKERKRRGIYHILSIRTMILLNKFIYAWCSFRAWNMFPLSSASGAGFLLLCFSPTDNVLIHITLSSTITCTTVCYYRVQVVHTFMISKAYDV